jgi:NADH-quinone oxidoreductase subunit E
MSPETVQELTGERRLRDPALQAQLLSSLYAAQEKHGYLTHGALIEVADELGLALSQVHDTASFYTLLHTEPTGRYVIQVCEGLSCYLSDGADRLVDHIGASLGIAAGETTPDGRFTLVTVQCLGSCGTAPAMRVNNELYEDLTPEDVDRIVEQLREERP